MKPKVILDAGHGADKPGAVFDPDVTVQGDEIKEKDINLDVVLALGMMLRNVGWEVIFTRDLDVDVPNVKRKQMINEFKPDCFVSIHCNASENHKSHGVESFYRDDLDYALANMCQQYLAAQTGLKDRGVFNDVGDLHKRLTVLDDSDSIPATLVEIGFIDSKEDREYILANKRTIAEILCGALVDWAAKRGLA